MNNLLTRYFTNYVDLKRAALKEDLEAGLVADLAIQV